MVIDVRDRGTPKVARGVHITTDVAIATITIAGTMHHAERPHHPRTIGILTGRVRGCLLAKGDARRFARAFIRFTVRNRAVAPRQRRVAGAISTLGTVGRCGASITDIGGASRQHE